MSYSPWMGHLMVGGTPGNYGTVKFLLDETDAAADHGFRVQVAIAGQGRDPASFEVEVFTNLNRRDFARLHEAVDQANQPTSYWISHPMQHAGQSFGNLVYTADLAVRKCGAYRLTARYRLRGSSTWWWHNDFTPFAGAGRQRDCAVLVSPRKAATVSLYEANALTIEATQGGDYENRSTLDDFLSTHDFDGFNPFHVGYIRATLGFNALWLMPVSPHTRWRWDAQAWNWGPNDSPGSPYASRDYWSINPWLADNSEPARAMQLFQWVVEEAEAAGVDVFVDVALNHAGRDVIYGEGAVRLGLCAAGERDAWIREVRPVWCTRGVEFRDGWAVPHYRLPAANGFECAVWAPADRLGEHVWDDANVDWFFGNYSALGPKPFGDARDYWGNPARHKDPDGNAEDERDLFYTPLDGDSETAKLWRYFAFLFPYWIEQTQGRLAGTRADFAQGLPNHAWEFIVNTTRQARWDFIFLAEVLDPDRVQYRLNKVFDVLTTKDHHLYRRTDVTMPELFASLEAEAGLFGGEALVMHNGTSHDEEGNPERWVMTARYAVAASLYGVPMVFMGQPLGQGHKQAFRESWAHMYDWWTAPDEERSAIAGMYKRINDARNASPELMERQRYFLSTRAGGFRDRIFSVARWIDTGSTDSVVLVFVNLSSTDGDASTFRIPDVIRLAGEYQAVNLVADDPGAHLWPASRTAQDIYTNGVFVQFSLPNEVQYLRLVRV
jgi:hypothetical protein